MFYRERVDYVLLLIVMCPHVKFIFVFPSDAYLYVTCRSQHRNKATALSMLQSRLHQMEVTRRAKANAQHTQSLSDVSWGNQIRSYVLQVRMFFVIYFKVLNRNP